MFGVCFSVIDLCIGMGVIVFVVVSEVLGFWVSVVEVDDVVLMWI